MFSPSDGWHDIPGDPQQHFIFNGYSVCKKYEKLPDGSHHDNDPLKHCNKCSENLSVLVAIGDKSRKIKMRDVFNLLDNLREKIKTKSQGDPVQHKEGVVAVLTSHNKKGEVVKKRFIT